MGYEVAILDGALPSRDGVAWTRLDRRLEAASGPATEALRIFQRLISRRPPFNRPLGVREEDAPFWFEDPAQAATGGVMHWRFSSSFADQAMPVIVETARPLALTVVDLSALLIHRPDGSPGFALVTDGGPPLAAPTWEQIAERLDEVAAEPAGYSSFAVLHGPQGGYVQWLGGNGILTVERREHDDDPTTHVVAGLRPDDARSALPASAAPPALADLSARERLSLADARELVADFFAGRGRSEQFAWRRWK